MTHLLFIFNGMCTSDRPYYGTGRKKLESKNFLTTQPVKRFLTIGSLTCLTLTVAINSKYNYTSYKKIILPIKVKVEHLTNTSLLAPPHLACSAINLWIIFSLCFYNSNTAPFKDWLVYDAKKLADREIYYCIYGGWQNKNVRLSNYLVAQAFLHGS